MPGRSCASSIRPLSLDGGLVTGITGQDGAYLAELLLGKGYRVVGGFRRASTVNTTRLEALGVAQDVDLVPFDLTDHGNMRLVQHLLDQGYEVVAGVHGREARLPPECECVKLDVTDKEGVRQLIGRTQPGEIYHLAGLTRPASGTVEEFYRVNFGGALNLLEAVRDRTPEAGFLLVSSAYVYGKVAHLISETEPHKPVNHYGVSKAAADLLGYTYAVKEGLNVVRVRPFNHSGPAQSPDFVLPSLVRQFAQVLVGNREPIIRLGNLDSVRDLSDVRDVVRGYRLALRKGRPGKAVPERRITWEAAGVYPYGDSSSWYLGRPG